MQSSRLSDRNECRGAARLAALTLVVLLGACERPLPPSPNRPQTMEQGRAPLVRRAIFRYDLPCAQSEHPQQPQGPARECRLLQV